MYFVERSFLGSLVLGWLFALIGLNIQHDANHGTLSKNGYVNWGFGLFQVTPCIVHAPPAMTIHEHL